MFALGYLFTCIFLFVLRQVMETDRMLYLVTEYASKGEIFGKRLVKCSSIIINLNLVLSQLLIHFLLNLHVRVLHTIDITTYQQDINMTKLQLNFLNSLIIHQVKTKKITAVKEVCIPSLNQRFSHRF